MATSINKGRNRTDSCLYFSDYFFFGSLSTLLLITCRHFILCSDQEGSAVLFAEFGLFNLSGRISGNICKDDLTRSLVAGKLTAVIVYLFFCAGKAFLGLDDRSSDLTKTLVRKSDNGNVIDRLKGMQEVFNLSGSHRRR